MEPMSPALAGRILTTRPQRKSNFILFKNLLQHICGSFLGPSILFHVRSIYLIMKERKKDIV